MIVDIGCFAVSHPTQLARRRLPAAAREPKSGLSGLVDMQAGTTKAEERCFPFPAAETGNQTPRNMASGARVACQSLAGDVHADLLSKVESSSRGVLVRGANFGLETWMAMRPRDPAAFPAWDMGTTAMWLRCAAQPLQRSQARPHNERPMCPGRLPDPISSPEGRVPHPPGTPPQIACGGVGHGSLDKLTRPYCVENRPQRARFSQSEHGRQHSVLAL